MIIKGIEFEWIYSRNQHKYSIETGDHYKGKARNGQEWDFFEFIEVKRDWDGYSPQPEKPFYWTLYIEGKLFGKSRFPKTLRETAEREMVKRAK